MQYLGLWSCSEWEGMRLWPVEDVHIHAQWGWPIHLGSFGGKMYVNIPYTLKIFIPIGFMGLVYLPTVVHIYIYMHCIILFPPGFSSNEKTDPTNSIQDSPVTAEAWIPRSESRGVSGDGWGIRWSENVCHLNQQKSSGGDPQQSQKWMNNEHAALQNTGCLQFFRCCLTSNRFFFSKKHIYTTEILLVMFCNNSQMGWEPSSVRSLRCGFSWLSQSGAAKVMAGFGHDVWG